MIKIYEMYYVEYYAWIRDLNLGAGRIYPFLLINDEYIWFLANFYLLSDGCFNGGLEFYGSLLNYADWYENPVLIAWNLLYNFGYVYNNVRDIVMYIR